MASDCDEEYNAMDRKDGSCSAFSLCFAFLLESQASRLLQLCLSAIAISLNEYSGEQTTCQPSTDQNAA